MDQDARYFLGVSLLIVAQVLVGTTVVYVVRRRMQVDPGMSWAAVLGAYLLLGVVVTVLTIVPVVGIGLALVVSLVGLKRLAGLQVLPTFILAFCLGLLVFLISAGISALLNVDV